MDSQVVVAQIISWRSEIRVPSSIKVNPPLKNPNGASDLFIFGSASERHSIKSKLNWVVSFCIFFDGFLKENWFEDFNS